VKKPLEAVNSLDWLNITFHTDNLSDIQNLLAQVTDGFEALERMKGSSQDCRDMYSGLHGLRVLAKPHNTLQHYIRLELPGGCCRKLGTDGVHKLLTLAEGWGKTKPRLTVKPTKNSHMYLFAGWRKPAPRRWKTTRLDIASDTTKLHPDWLWRVKDDIAGRFAKDKVQHFQNGRGTTTQFGSRESDKMITFYTNDGNDADKQPFGEGVAFTRVEQRFFGDAAHQVTQRLLMMGADSLSYIASGLLKGYMDVPKRWWKSFIGTVAAAPIMLHRARSTVEKTKRWLQRQVAPALALVVDAEEHAERGFGLKLLNDLLQSGAARRTSVGMAQVRTNERTGALNLSWATAPS
jgi:hypothetical protein